MRHAFAMPTPYEQGDQNQTTTWSDCVRFYEALARQCPALLRFTTLGVSDTGVPLHAGVVSADGVFEPAAIKQAGRAVFFNNNGIHPGEPEGIDACMALVRDLCADPSRLGDAVFVFIPVYNVDGCLNRGNASRVNQDGPEALGFRGNGQHLDLNRDFIKCDSLNARHFSEFFATWDPDVMVDTHTSNGADYPYTMTLIHTQPDKLGGSLGAFLREQMLPAVYDAMQARGWPTCPYVNLLRDCPEGGLADFMDLPRFSTGFAALHHTLGFMPETHMLKPFRDRYEAMRALLDVTLAFTVANAAAIQTLRRGARQQARAAVRWPVRWAIDTSRPARLRFQGYKAVWKPSLLGDYQRLAYDRNQPWAREITYLNQAVPTVDVAAPLAYVLPRAWRAVAERLQWNGVQMQPLPASRPAQARVHRILGVKSRPGPYEGHLFHDEMTLDTTTETVALSAGDWWIPMDQDRARFAVETLEPLAHDSYFRWGFFNSILEKKEHFSDYVFEDLALQLLKDEPALADKFTRWKAAHPALLTDQAEVLGFIFENCARFAEPGWRRYPVLAVLAMSA